MLRGVVRGVPDRRPRTVRRMFRLPVGIPTDIIQRASGLTMRKNCLAKRSRGSGRARAVRKSLIGFLLLTVLRRRSLAAAESASGALRRCGRSYGEHDSIPQGPCRATRFRMRFRTYETNGRQWSVGESGSSRDPPDGTYTNLVRARPKLLSRRRPCRKRPTGPDVPCESTHAGEWRGENSNVQSRCLCPFLRTPRTQAARALTTLRSSSEPSSRPCIRGSSSSTCGCRCAY